MEGLDQTETGFYSADLADDFTKNTMVSSTAASSPEQNWFADQDMAESSVVFVCISLIDKVIENFLWIGIGGLNEMLCPPLGSYV